MIRPRLLLNPAQRERDALIKNPWLFASVARRDDGLKSDIDVLVDGELEKPGEWMERIDRMVAALIFQFIFVLIHHKILPRRKYWKKQYASTAYFV